MSGTGESGSVRESLENAVETVMGGEEQTQGNLSDTTPEVIAAPETWGDEDKGRFEKITDADTRKWLVDLDKNYTTKGQEAATQLSEYSKVFEPYSERLKTTGQTGPKVVEGLLQAQMILESPEKAAEGIKWLVDHYNIDKAKVLEILGAAGVDQQQEDQKEDPLAELNPGLKAWLQDQLKPVQELRTQQEKADQEKRDQVKKEADDAIISFRTEKDDKGQDKYPMLKKPGVPERIALLIKSGDVDIAKAGGINPALKEAYDQACRALPSVREEYMKSIAPPVDKERILNARRAGVSVQGSGSSAPSQAASGSLRDTLKAKMENASLL